MDIMDSGSNTNCPAIFVPFSNILKQQLYRKSVAFSDSAKIAESVVTGKICRGGMNQIQINFDSHRALQWRTSHLAFLRRNKPAKWQAMEVNGMPWKSGNVVRLATGGEAMTVIGRDSVGSVICRPLNDERHLGIYVPPSSLVAADSSGPFTESTAENA